MGKRDEAIDLTDEEKQELDRRIAEHDANPDDLLIWDELSTAIKKRKER